MKKDKVLGVVRHVLTFAGGILVVSGNAETTLVNEAAGAVIAAIGLIWSLVEKANRPQLPQA